MKPELFTFDIFGTILDWQTGMANEVIKTGISFESPSDLDRVIDLQGKDEQGVYQSYREITKDSLVKAFGMPEDLADAIGACAGTWPLFSDSREGIKLLMGIAPCIAMTNSDRAHGEQIQASLGFPLSDWICAEETGVYKPSPEFWHFVSQRTRVPFSRRWWHVSAYADYDLSVAKDLGLTCVYIPRAHSRPGSAHLEVPDLVALAQSILDGSAVAHA